MGKTVPICQRQSLPYTVPWWFWRSSRWTRYPVVHDWPPWRAGPPRATDCRRASADQFRFSESPWRRLQTGSDASDWPRRVGKRERKSRPDWRRRTRPDRWPLRPGAPPWPGRRTCRRFPGRVSSGGRWCTGKCAWSRRSGRHGDHPKPEQKPIININTMDIQPSNSISHPFPFQNWTWNHFSFCRKYKNSKVKERFHSKKLKDSAFTLTNPGPAVHQEITYKSLQFVDHAQNTSSYCFLKWPNPSKMEKIFCVHFSSLQGSINQSNPSKKMFIFFTFFFSSGVYKPIKPIRNGKDFFFLHFSSLQEAVYKPIKPIKKEEHFFVHFSFLQWSINQSNPSEMEKISFFCIFLLFRKRSINQSNPSKMKKIFLPFFFWVVYKSIKNGKMSRKESRGATFTPLWS